MTIFLAAQISSFNPCYHENAHIYATTKELKKKALFKEKEESIKQIIDIQVTIILEIKFQKCMFLQNIAII